jgi:hypothetical protein
LGRLGSGKPTLDALVGKGEVAALLAPPNDDIATRGAREFHRVFIRLDELATTITSFLSVRHDNSSLFDNNSTCGRLLKNFVEWDLLQY